jgi:hypothetical protein
MRAVKEFGAYLSDRLAKLEKIRRETGSDDLSEVNLAISELNYIYVNILPRLEEDLNEVRDNNKRRHIRHNRRRESL